MRRRRHGPAEGERDLLGEERALPDSKHCRGLRVSVENARGKQSVTMSRKSEAEAKARVARGWPWRESTMAKEGIRALEAEKSLPLAALAPPNAAARHITPTCQACFRAMDGSRLGPVSSRLDHQNE